CSSFLDFGDGHSLSKVEGSPKEPDVHQSGFPDLSTRLARPALT
ncbi:hypothetical protein A2U01_0109262, partial [Trifolium medium]|nr:hypothetical protein [Trifolium medium]